MVARWVAAFLIVATSCSPVVTKKAQGPSIALDDEIWEFGSLKRGETVSTEIAVTNRGTDTLHISLHSTCDCLAATAEAQTVPPGERTSILLSYTGETIKDHATKTLFVDSDDKANPRLSVTATGQVVPGDLPHMVALPDPLMFDKSESADPFRMLTVANRGKQELLIKEVRCFGCLNAWSQASLGGGEEVPLDIEILPDWSDGRWIEIESNDPVWPVRKVVIVNLN
ncbi:MAG: DUF1573 domain-containing protein [Candidatus Eisenbacteria bacterium]